MQRNPVIVMTGNLSWTWSDISYHISAPIQFSGAQHVLVLDLASMQDLRSARICQHLKNRCVLVCAQFLAFLQVPQVVCLFHSVCTAGSSSRGHMSPEEVRQRRRLTIIKPLQHKEIVKRVLRAQTHTHTHTHTHEHMHANGQTNMTSSLHHPHTHCKGKAYKHNRCVSSAWGELWHTCDGKS